MVQSSVDVKQEAGSAPAVAPDKFDPGAIVSARVAASKCPTCGGTALSWSVGPYKASDIVDGRLRASEAESLFSLGCDECPETVALMAATDFIKVLNAGIGAEPVAETPMPEPLPKVNHKGPNDTDASMFMIAAQNLERGFPVGGSNLTSAVAKLLRREIDRAGHVVRSPFETGTASRIEDLDEGATVRCTHGRIAEARTLSFCQAGGTTRDLWFNDNHETQADCYPLTVLGFC